MVSKGKDKYYQQFLGRFYKELKTFTDADLKYFDSLNIDPDKSYFFIGDKVTLDKAGFYILMKQCPNQIYDFYPMDVFMDDTINGEYSIIGQPLLIIYRPRTTLSYGNMRAWTCANVSSKVVSRELSGERTIILSEGDEELITESCRDYIEIVRLHGKNLPRQEYKLQPQKREYPKSSSYNKGTYNPQPQEFGEEFTGMSSREKWERLEEELSSASDIEEESR